MDLSKSLGWRWRLEWIQRSNIKCRLVDGGNFSEQPCKPSDFRPLSLFATRHQRIRIRAARPPVLSFCVCGLDNLLRCVWLKNFSHKNCQIWTSVILCYILFPLHFVVTKCYFQSGKQHPHTLITSATVQPFLHKSNGWRPLCLVSQRVQTKAGLTDQWPS